MAEPSAAEPLLVSLAGKEMSRWMKGVVLILGIFLLGDGLRQYLGNYGLGAVASKLLIGAACLYVLGFRKRIYLADEGLVKETRTWLSRTREVFPWEEVKFVTLAFRGDKMMALFERDITGWRLPFERADEERVRRILRERIPRVEVDLVGKN
jgi:hypothetical protein